MARIQILELPSVIVGDNLETPFAIIIDQVEQGEAPTSWSGESLAGKLGVEAYNRAASAIKLATGARGVIATAGTLDIA
jgi:hypothetical protein